MNVMCVVILMYYVKINNILILIILMCINDMIM